MDDFIEEPFWTRVLTTSAEKWKSYKGVEMIRMIYRTDIGEFPVYEWLNAEAFNRSFLKNKYNDRAKQLKLPKDIVTNWEAISYINSKVHAQSIKLGRRADAKYYDVLAVSLEPLNNDDL